MLDELLRERALLPILTMNDGTPVTRETWPERRREMLDALCRDSYGFTPPRPTRVWGEVLSETGPRCYAGKVHQQKIQISLETDRGVFSFPILLSVPRHTERPPVFLNLAFRFQITSGCIPTEEITDHGYALATLCYLDVVNDREYADHADFSDGLGAYFGVSNHRAPTEWGKIGMWAYGASAVLDYLFTRDDVDAAHTAVIGHSRLGKTALWAAAQDERFWCAVSNDSGYGGAATSKHGEGERVTDFLNYGSWAWFCENFKKYTGPLEDEKPYDQAYLLALLAPRLLCVGSAENDHGADPKSEFLTSLWASSAWELFGERGLVTPDRLPVPGDFLRSGSVCYHLRPGEHFLSREDWLNYIRFLDGKLGR